MQTNYEIVVKNAATLGEGPAWDARNRTLLWIDIVEECVNIFDPQSGKNKKITVGEPVGSVVPRKKGDYVIATNRGIISFSADGKKGEILASYEVSHAEHINDGKCDKLGRYWTGTMAEDRASPVCSLYRVDPNYKVQKILSNIIVSNGMAWNSQNNKMYYIDTRTKYLDVFDFDLEKGIISNCRHFIDYTHSTGLPDGMTIDAENYLWVAIWGGWCVHRYSPEGKLDRVMELPVERVTSCCFGGEDLTDLYITTSKNKLSKEQLTAQPLAGSLFRIKTDVKGTQTQTFKG